jgi:hypothetical protein
MSENRKLFRIDRGARVPLYDLIEQKVPDRARTGSFTSDAHCPHTVPVVEREISQLPEPDDVAAERPSERRPRLPGP